MKNKFVTSLTLSSCFLFMFFTVINLSGKWTGTDSPTPQDSFTLSYNFMVVKDSVLTGTFIGPDGSIDIENGVVKGTDFSFDIEGRSGKVHNTGKYYGDSIVVTMPFPRHSLTMTFHRDK